MLKLLLAIFTFVQLNCENLFDIFDNPAKDDDEYTEEGFRHWDKRKYYEKIYNIGKEIVSCGERPDGQSKIPDMIALCEVESDSVMVGLTQRTMLWPYHYEYLITDSPDTRGINTALIYNPNSFKLLESHSIRVNLPDDHPTRDILYAKGLMANLDTLHVMVVHAPSRRGGEKASRPNRMAVAERLGEVIDSIGNNGHIIIAGDFNDYSGDPALQHLEDCGMNEVSKNATSIYNIRCKGTYFYDGKWESLDHIFTSSTLSEWKIDCHINDHPSLLEVNNIGDIVPKRSYIGRKYNGGFSDHLPLVFRFNVKL